MPIRKEAETEKRKLENMSWEDGAWCVWEYYKFYIPALILAAGALRIVGTMIYRQIFTTRLPIAVINDRAGTTSSTAGLEAGLKEAFGCNSKDLIGSNEGPSANSSGDSMSQYDYTTLAKISTLVASRSLDAVIGDQVSADHYVSINAYQNLEEYLPPEFYYKVEDHIYRANDEWNSLQSFAVSLGDTAFAQETEILMDPPYLAVMSSAPHKEAALVAVGYLFPWPVVGYLHSRLVIGYLLP